MEKLNPLFYYQTKKSLMYDSRNLCILQQQHGRSCWLATGTLEARNASPQLVLYITEYYYRQVSRHRATHCWTSTVTDTVGPKCGPKHSRRQAPLASSVSPPGAQYHSMFLPARFASGKKAAIHGFSL